MRKLTVVLLVVISLVCFNNNVSAAEQAKNEPVAVVIKNMPMTDGTLQPVWASGIIVDPSPVYFPVRIHSVIEILLLTDELKPLDGGRLELAISKLAEMTTAGPVGEGEFVVVYGNRYYHVEGNPRYPHSIVIDLQEEAPDYVYEIMKTNFKHSKLYADTDRDLHNYTIRK